MNTLDLEQNFFDRRSIMDLLKRRVIDLKEGYRQNLAFLGPKHIGKTSILRRFASDLEDEMIIEIYLDLENRDFHYFVSKFIGGILYNFARVKKLDLEDDINLLMEATKRYIPQTVEEIKKIRSSIAKGKLTEAYKDLISLPEIFTLESGRFCMIVLDEFHNLEDLSVPNAFQELGKKIMTQRRCIYIVTSSLGAVAKTILSEKLSLLFGNFEIIQIQPFDLKTSQAFIEYSLGEVKISSSLRNFLIDFTGGHPFYLNIICQEIIDLCAVHRQYEVFLPLLSQALENTIFNRWGILSRHFELMLDHLGSGKGNKQILYILIALANGKHKIKDIIDDIKLKQNIVTSKLNRLLELSVVVKNGNFYHYQDKLLKYWIKYVFQRKLQVIDCRAEYQQKHFKAEIGRIVNNFLAVSQRDLSSRIVELLHCFDNESFDLNGRRYKLPSFGEVTSVEFENTPEHSFKVLKADSSEGSWFIIIKEDCLLEGEVNAFLTESKKIDHKPQRRIVIALSDLDANIKLKALQEKMWVWNENELNTLLSFYDKPYILK